jgi:hypothetical protein
MKIDLYVVTYNDEFMLPYFFKHYDQFVRWYFVFDNMSTDSTRDILRSKHNVTIFDNYSPGLDSMGNTDWKNRTWKQFSRSDADWIICCDSDEFLYCKTDLLEKLDLYDRVGISVPRTCGLAMAYEWQPCDGSKQIWQQFQQGSLYENRIYNKPMIFSAKRIDNINYSSGCHYALPEGQIRYSPLQELFMLHYAYPPEAVIRKQFEVKIVRAKLLEQGKDNVTYFNQNDMDRRIGERSYIMAQGLNVIDAIQDDCFNLEKGTCG